MALVPAAGGILKSLFGENKATAPQAAVYTPQAQDAIARAMWQYMQGQNLNYGTPVTVGQASATQSRTLSPAETKQAAYVDYLVSQGIDPEVAGKKAYQMVGKFKTDKGFKQAIKGGEYQDLRVSGGKIKASPKMVGGGVQVTPEQQTLQSLLQKFNTGAIGSAMNMPAMYAADEQRALGLRQGLSAPIINRAFAANANGLTPDTQAAINAIIGENKRAYGSMLNEGLQRATAELYDSGFGTSSSFVPAVMNQVLGKASSDYASKSAAQMAGIYSDMLTQGQARDTQALTNQLNTYNQLSQISGIGNILGGVMAPSQVGGMTDIQAAQLAAQIQQANIQNRRADQQEANRWMGQPVNYLPEEQGWLSRLGKAAFAASPFVSSRTGANTGVNTV